MPTTAQVMAWAEAYRQAWEHADTPAAVALFAEDSSYRSNIFEEPYLGRKGVEEYWSTVTARAVRREGVDGPAGDRGRPCHRRVLDTDARRR